MPLPTSNITWPPPDQAEALKLYAKYGAWYSGDPEQLSAVYADTLGMGGPLTPSNELPVGQPPAPRFLAGLVRGVQRMFWGTPPSVGQVRGHKVHIPLAGDIAATSADLLYGEAPEIKLPDAGKGNPTQERLDVILEEANAEAVWLESAEIGSAYGGSYIRIKWDPVVADSPLLDVIPPDAGIPEFRGVRLAAVTFWRDLERINGKFWRHLERHDPGIISHGLYMSGDEHKLGRPMALQDHPATAQFAMLVDAGDGQSITTGAKGLTAEYFPNMRPNRVMRGSPLGRSDYAGIEPIMDQLDEAWTSWMRDLRLGKGRLVVPRSYMQSSGRGKGAHFDAEREIFEVVDALTSPDGGLAMQIVQFNIRVDEHARTCAELQTLALRGAGYSAQTFGEQGDIAQTATEVTARNEQSFRTRGKKIRYSRGPLARICRTLLEVDAEKFGTKGIAPDLPTVDWPDGVAVDPQDQAQTLQLLAAAEAASIETRVKILHPDWEDTDVAAEVKKIKDDAVPPVPPMPPPGAGITGHGPDGPAPGGPDHPPQGNGGGPGSPGSSSGAPRGNAPPASK